jgi:integrase
MDVLVVWMSLLFVRDTEYVQQLMAHGDKKMTEYYQSGHETKWMDVRADLNLDEQFKK